MIRRQRRRDIGILRVDCTSSTTCVPGRLSCNYSTIQSIVPFLQLQDRSSRGSCGECREDSAQTNVLVQYLLSLPQYANYHAYYEKLSLMSTMSAIARIS